MTVDYTTAYEAISADIAYNATFSSAALSIQSIVNDIKSENENIQAGTTALTTNMPGLITNLIGNIGLCLNNFLTTFLTPEDQDLYYSGDVSIDDIVSTELWVYYNTLQQLLMYAKGMNGVIKSIPVSPTIRFSSSSNDYTLTEDEFNSTNSQEIDNETGFYLYTVLAGDNSRIIAFREMGNQDLFVQILRINNISEDDFIDGTLVGQQIKIPRPNTSITNGDDNLIYESDAENADAFFFGSDLSLDENGGITVSGTGDIGSLTGIENAYQAIVQRLDARKGSLNVFNSDWGTTSLGDGNVPLLVRIDRFLTDQITQIQSDPRVKSAAIDFNKIVIDGEKISAPMKVYWIGSDQTSEVTVNG